MSAGLIRKSQGTVEAPSAAQPLPRMVLTTSDVDRVGDRVVPEGAALDHFKRCPSLLLNHNHDAMIGKVVDIAVEPGKRITAMPDFHEESDLSKQCKRLYELGYYNGISIGFAPTESPVPLTPGPTGRPGFEYRSWELHEVSLTSVPANPHCTVIRSILDAGSLNGAPLHPLVRKSLEASMSDETKAMNEGTASAGGATVPPDPMAEEKPTGNDPLSSMREAIQRIVADALEIGFANLQAKTDAVPPAMAGAGASSLASEDEPDAFALDEDEDEEQDEDTFAGGMDDESAEDEGVDDDPPFEGDEEEDDEDDEDLLSRYRRRAVPERRKTAASLRKSYKVHASTLKEVADHLDSMAKMKAGTPWSKMHGSACRYHAEKMAGCLKALDEMPEDQPAPESDANANGETAPSAESPTEPQEKTGEVTQEAIQAALKSALSPLSDQIYAITGRRVAE